MAYSKVFYDVSAPWTRDSNYQADTSGTSQKMYGAVSGSDVVKRPNWKQLPMPSRSNPLAYNRIWRFEWVSQRDFSHTEKGPTQFFYWDYDGPGPIWGAVNSVVETALPTAEYTATNRLLSTLSGEGTNVANMIGERKQILGMVTHTMSRIAYAARDLRRGNITSAIRRFNGDPKTARKLRGTDIANQWLELQYGWKPLLSDVYGLVENLHDRSNLPFVIRESAKANASRKTLGSSAFIPPYGSGTATTEAICKYMIRVKPNRVLATPSALGLTNPAVVAWELLPWSFVVDWFLPVGSYLEQHTASHGWDWHDGCKSTLTKSNEFARRNKLTSYTSGTWTYTDTDRYSVENKYVDFRRVILTDFPSPKIPRFKNPLSMAHFQNSLALMYQAFGRGGKFR